MRWLWKLLCKLDVHDVVIVVATGSRTSICRHCRASWTQPAPDAID